MKIYDVTDGEFQKYGRIVDEIDFSGLVKALEEHTPVPEGVAYVPGAGELESLPVKEELQRRIYGELPIQVGYCNGHNSMLNALEYHKSSEINVMATDAILLLGRQQDIAGDFTYDTSLVEAFLVPKGTAVEMYATTLHYAPCHTDEAEGFRVAVALPRGTNEAKPAIKAITEEDQLLWARNKWLLAHEDSAEAGQGAAVRLSGDNNDIANDI